MRITIHHALPRMELEIVIRQYIEELTNRFQQIGNSGRMAHEVIEQVQDILTKRFWEDGCQGCLQVRDGVCSAV